MANNTNNGGSGNSYRPEHWEPTRPEHAGMDHPERVPTTRPEHAPSKPAQTIPSTKPGGQNKPYNKPAGKTPPAAAGTAGKKTVAGTAGKTSPAGGNAAGPAGGKNTVPAGGGRIETVPEQGGSRAKEKRTGTRKGGGGWIAVLILIALAAFAVVPRFLQREDPEKGGTAGTQQTASPSGPAYDTVQVAALEGDTIRIDPVTSSMKAVANANCFEYAGTISQEKQVDTYTFMAPWDGTYRVDVNSLLAGTAVKLNVSDYLGSQVASNGCCANGEGCTAEKLSAGATYTVTVEQRSEYSAYVLSIWCQKGTMDISSTTELMDSIEFEDQSNVYSFVPALDGCYRFEIAKMMADATVSVRVRNALGESLEYNSYCKNGDGVTAKDLKAGEQYQVVVQQVADTSSYSLLVGQQKEPVDISSAILLSDSVEYKNQKNVYPFTTDVSGTCHFELSGMQSGTYVNLNVLNQYNESVARNSYCNNGQSVSFEATAGEQYRLEVEQNEGYSQYSLMIGRQKPKLKIFSNIILQDSMQYEGQKNIYMLTPDSTGKVRITVDGLPEYESVLLELFNDLGERQTGYYCSSGDFIEADVTAGSTYEIRVSESDSLTSYKLTVEQ